MLLELLSGVVIARIAKDKMLGSNVQNEAKSEVERLHIENEKYSNRNIKNSFNEEAADLINQNSATLNQLRAEMKEKKDLYW